MLFLRISLPPSGLYLNRPIYQLLLTYPVPDTLLNIPGNFNKVGLLLVRPKPHKPPSTRCTDLFVPSTLDDRILQGYFPVLRGLDLFPIVLWNVHIAPYFMTVTTLAACPNAELIDGPRGYLIERS